MVECVDASLIDNILQDFATFVDNYNARGTQSISK
jgi:hypothetical protein